MNDCQNLEADLSALIDGELSAERQTDVIEHIDSCPACARRVAELQRLAAGINAMPKLKPPPQFAAAVHDKIRAGGRAVPERGTPGWRDVLLRPVWLKVPLEVLAVVAVVLWLTRSRQTEQVLAMNAAPSRSPAVRAKILPDEKAAEIPAASAKMEYAELPANSFTAAPTGAGVGGNLADALRAEPPGTVIVRGESLVAVRLRVSELAQTLSGQVESATPSNTFIVHLPATKVNEFRSRLTPKPGTMYTLGTTPAVEVKVIVEPIGR